MKPKVPQRQEEGRKEHPSQVTERAKPGGEEWASGPGAEEVKRSRAEAMRHEKLMSPR